MNFYIQYFTAFFFFFLQIIETLLRNTLLFSFDHIDIINRIGEVSNDNEVETLFFGPLLSKDLGL